MKEVLQHPWLTVRHRPALLHPVRCSCRYHSPFWPWLTLLQKPAPKRPLAAYADVRASSIYRYWVNGETS